MQTRHPTPELHFPQRAKMADDLSDDIRTNASQPRRAAADGVQSEQHSLADQIAADKYLKSKAAASSRKTRGLRFNKLKPPGTA